ncbi:MAG TPA: ABC transporter ATP-binding protein [Mycobacteriales bacterium]|jgi:ABC-2 type transport system ATP-binding protein|nr:ABC transporter ATP-binding protein [Mycobacteriales bacterium]
MSKATAIRVRGLTKRYGDVQALAGVDLDIAVGEVFALLGPNGAGKTTTVEILEGYRRRDGGDVDVFGLDPARQAGELKERIGIVLQSSGLDPYLTVAETVELYAYYYPHRRPVDEVIELVGLQAKRNERVVRLSGGQRRRLDVAIALAGDPDLLFLDEPTTGFDPAARQDAWQIVKDLARLGKTVVLTTHYLDEAEQLADRVAIIAGGKIVIEDTPGRLGGRDRRRPRLVFHLPETVALPRGFNITVAPDGYCTVEPDDLTDTLHRLTGWARRHGLSLDDLQLRRPTLEDTYHQLLADHAADDATASFRVTP